MKRLTPATLSMIMFLVVGGLIATFVVKKLIARDEKAPQIATRLVPIPIADIQAGTTVTEAHIGEGRVRESQLEPDMLISNRVIVGRIAKEKLTSRSPIKASQLYPPGEAPPLKLEEGMVAATVEIPGSAGIVGGNVRPGNYCDVHFTPNQIPYATDPSNSGLTMTLFKGVKILAIRGQSMNSQSHTVTFELTPMQMNIIELARQKGILTLAYQPAGKGDGGVAVKNKDRVMLEEILGITPPKKEEPPQPFTTQTYRGTGRHQTQFLPNNQLQEQQGGYVPPANNGSNSIVPFNGSNNRSSGAPAAAPAPAAASPSASTGGGSPAGQTAPLVRSSSI